MNEDEVDIMDLIDMAQTENDLEVMLAGTDVTHGYCLNGVVIAVSGSHQLPSPVDYNLPTIDG